MIRLSKPLLCIYNSIQVHFEIDSTHPSLEATTNKDYYFVFQDIHFRMAILFLFLLLEFVLSEYRLTDSFFTLWTGHKLSNYTKVVENGTAINVLHCAMQCFNHNHFIAANFKESLKTCETLMSDTRDLSVRITTQTGCEVVVKKGKDVSWTSIYCSVYTNKQIKGNR